MLLIGYSLKDRKRGVMSLYVGIMMLGDTESGYHQGKSKGEVRILQRLYLKLPFQLYLLKSASILVQIIYSLLYKDGFFVYDYNGS